MSENHVTEHKHGGLGQLPATAICGNDITSSCLYVSALAILAAGRWAPLVLLMVAGVLYLFRSIYAEVVGALPLNGGAYNALLNTTSKFRASIAACLTILSYMATAVISAYEAMHYAHNLLPMIHIIYATIALLALFMCLSIIGISESAVVAIGIFIFHLFSLTLLVLVGIFFVATNGIVILFENMATPTEGGLLKALFFGFAAALLGISGFESSANYVEEQAEGIFPKTLRNMWIAVSVFNPLMAVLALALIPLGDINDDNKNALLANMGDISGGKWLSWLISIDAVLVLSGAVLTSFVGVNGLVHRMALDRCLPQFLLKRNRRGTTHRIIIAFFILSISVLLVTQGDLEALAGVYTISFLSVMALFCLGNILLKVKREKLPRPSRATWAAVMIALAAVSAGLVGNGIKPPKLKPAVITFAVTGNIIKHDAAFNLVGPSGTATVTVSDGDTIDEVIQRFNKLTQQTGVAASTIEHGVKLSTIEVGQEATLQIQLNSDKLEFEGTNEEGVAKGSDGVSNLRVFLPYFIPSVLIVSVMLGRITLLKACLFVIRGMIGAMLQPMHAMTHTIREKIEQINSQQVVFFTRGGNIANLNVAMLYVKQNEHTNRIKIVTVVDDPKEVSERLKQDIEFLDDAYPEIDIEFVIIKGTFGPELVQELSDRWNIPKNFMFIGSPGDHFMYGLAELGGVRLII